MEFEAIKVICVCGAGVMGYGIAHVIALEGYKVFPRDVGRELLDAALDGVKNSLQKAAEKGLISQDRVEGTLSMIMTTTDIEEAAKAADFVIEAIPEKLELKKELFRQLDELCKEGAIFATNTSTLSITEMASVTKGLTNSSVCISLIRFQR